MSYTQQCVRQRCTTGSNVNINKSKLLRTRKIIPILMMTMIIMTVLMTVIETTSNNVCIDAFIPSSSSSSSQQRYQHIRRLGVTTTTTTTSDDDEIVLPTNASILPTTGHTATAVNTMDSSYSSSLDTIINLTNKEISQMSFRELQRHVRTLLTTTTRTATGDGDEEITRGMTTSILRDKIRSLSNLCIIREDGLEDCSYDDDAERVAFQKFIDFVDVSNPTQELVTDIQLKCQQNHWKAATRKLKKLTRQLSAKSGGGSNNNSEEYYDVVTEELLLQVLTVCAANRLQGARASEPSRKIMEQLVELGYTIPSEVGNYCIQNTLDETTKNSMHQGFGGIDTALAMVAAMEKCQTPINVETYDKLIFALAKEGSIASSLSILREQVVERSVTPPLATFATLANIALQATAAASSSNSATTSTTTTTTTTTETPTTESAADPVFTLLAYAKAAGYDLDSIASMEEGRSLLASGVIAAERANNDVMGFRLLKAASDALDVAPDRGDTMVALSSSAAQRACTLIHKRAVNKAVMDNDWQLAVKVLELMIRRFLKPSPWVWRNVITCCAKAQKSKKATGLLLDWCKLYEQGKVDKPPLSVFNTCVNVCEICNEQDLTLLVLDTMQKTHKTDGNLITFNIALKRLAKSGNYLGCEGIIMGMLQADVEPSVVSYTTAIASCVSSEVRQPTIAYEWLRRMRSRNVQPNAITYNTVLTACLDGTMEGSYLASKIAKEMLADVDQQLIHDADAAASSNYELDEYRNVIPDASTKVAARKLMEQLKQNWIDGFIAKAVATETVRVPLLQLVDFQKSEAAERARQQEALRQQNLSKIKTEEDQNPITKRVEIEIESLAHRVAEV